MFNSETMRRALEDRNLKVVAKLSGITYMSLYRFARGQSTSMSYENMLKLSDYLTRGFK